MKAFKTSMVILVFFLLLPAYPLFSRTSSANPQIIGLYDLDYFLLLMAYLSLPVAILVYIPFVRASHVDRFEQILVWLQKRKWLVILSVYTSIELWYMLRRIILKTGYFHGNSYRLIISGVLLCGLWGVLMVMFAHRTPDERREIVLQMGLAIGSAIFTFVILSYLLMATDYNNMYVAMNNWGLMRFDWKLGYIGRGNIQDYQFFGGPEDQSASYTLDENGFRNDKDVTNDPVAVIGDSFVFGVWLPASETLTAQLEDNLNVPVANYGQIGYSLYHYNQVIDTYVRDNNHQMLIYMIYENDLINDQMLDDDIGSRFIHNGVGIHLSPIIYTWWLIFDISPLDRLFTFINNQDGAIVEAADGEVGSVSPPTANYPESVITNAYSRLDQAISLADELDLELIVVTIPSKYSVYVNAESGQTPQALTAEENAYDLICTYVSAEKIPCYNFTQDMRLAAQTNSSLYFPDDDHFDAPGARVASDLIAEFVRENSHLVDIP